MTQRYLVPAIKRAFEIIELLVEQESGMNISELHRVLRLPLSSTATIVYTLTDLGYLLRDKENTRYRLSVKLFGMARRALDRKELVTQCHAALKELVRESGLTGHLAVLRDGDSVYIDRVQGNGLVQISSYVGLHWPAHTSAVGKALLAFLPDPELARVLKQMTLKKLTPHTIRSKRVLEKQLRMFRRLGYAWEQNEGELGLGCVAAPIYGPDHELTAAISLSGTTHQIAKAKIPALGAVVKRYAKQMSARLGDQP